MNINAIAVDDEPKALDVIRFHTGKIPFLKLNKTFRNPFRATDYLNYYDIDLIFLDINMPDMSGMQFVKSIRKHPMIIFTTAYSEFAVQSYEVEAVDYLLKPIELARFTQALNKAYKLKIMSHEQNTYKRTKNRDTILIKCGTDIKKVALNNIRFVKSDGNYMVFHLDSGDKLMSRMTVNEALCLLSKGAFSRVHRSVIVNHNHIDVFRTDSLLMGDMEIPVGDSFRRAFFRKFDL